MKKLLILLIAISTLSAKAQSPRLMLYAVDSTLTSVITPFYISQVGMFGYYKDLIGKPTLSTVATTGAYSDLSGKPTIYTFTGSSSQYTKGDGTYGTLPSGYTFTGTISQYTKGDGTYATFPTNVSTFTNDAGYLSASSIPNLITKSANYTIVSGDFASGKPAILHAWVDCSGGSRTLTLPPASTFSGYFIAVGKTDNSGNSLTISGCSYDNIETIQNTVKEFYSNGATWVQN